MTHIVFPDICTIRHALGGSLCPDVQCRRTDAGRTDCGSKNCHNGTLDNGFGSLAPGDENYLADMVANPASFGLDDERNHALAAVARMVSDAKSGAIALGSSRYHDFELARQLTGAFSVEESADTMKVLRTLTTTSHGAVVTVDDAKRMEDNWTGLLSDADEEFLFGERSNGKALIDYEDSMFLAAMLATGQPVTIVSNDAGLIAAGRRMAALYAEFYVVDTATYASPVKYAQEKARLDAIHAAATSGALAAYC